MGSGCYDWGNRVHFVVKHLYDIDNNGYLDSHDFECLALDGHVTVEEFKQAVQNLCVGKTFEQFPQPLKHAINCKYATADANGDGLLSLDEFRLECISRQAIRDLDEIDDSYQRLITDEDRKRGGITLSRYQELFAEFLGCPDVSGQGIFLFGPLPDYA
ncbi:sarcoplasmic calcium-binding protein 1 isoform X3 [Ixodes scapularis]|uniref:sarcoplasmic calcium-binding protein 1 isoform X3 n=1 Tax=Ixodes scapularis TaxID=6945 RepID=UPI0011619788|nr:sarcoplasmic calcium-binding protein 1 isoform X3 [Ixodes scapularis]